MKTNEEKLIELKKDVKRWVNYLNLTLGLLAINFAFAALGTKSPSINATIGLIVILGLAFLRKNIIKQFILIRNKKEKSDFEKSIVPIINDLMGIRAVFTKALLFLIGIIFLGFISASYLLSCGETSDFKRSVERYVYGEVRGVTCSFPWSASVE